MPSSSRVQSRSVADGASILTIFCLFSLLNRLCFEGISLSEMDYSQGLLFVQWLNKSGSWVVALILLITLFKDSGLASPFFAFDRTKYLQISLPFLAASVLTWSCTTFAYNYAFGTSFFCDRLLLIALNLLILFRPSAVGLYILQLLLMLGQLRFASGEMDWTDKQLVIQILIMFQSCLIAGWFLPQSLWIPLFMQISLIVAAYSGAGIAKLTVGPNIFDWVMTNQLSNLVVNARIFGWLPQIPNDVFQFIIKDLSVLTLPLAIFTLCIEVGSILSLLTRKGFAALCLGRIALHVGIFLVSGICFWKLVLINLVLLSLTSTLFAQQQEESIAIPLRARQLSIPFMILYCLAFSPMKLGWFDTNVCITYETSLSTEQEQTILLPSSFFSPYDINFSQRRFWFLKSDLFPVVDTYGTSYFFDDYQSLKNVKNIEDIREIAKRFMYSTLENTDRVRMFKKFLHTFIISKLADNNCKLTRTRHWYDYLRAPRHIWQTDSAPAFITLPIKDISVTVLAYTHNDSIISKLFEQRLLQIPFSAEDNERLQMNCSTDDHESNQ